MSTLYTLGYIGGPPGSPQALPVQYIVANFGTFNGTYGLDCSLNTSDPNYQLAQTKVVPYSDASGTVGGWITGVPFFTSISTLRGAALSRDYWPSATPTGWSRDGDVLYKWSAGTSIRVSAAEVVALAAVGGIALGRG